jgi:hypothetical protein
MRVLQVGAVILALVCAAFPFDPVLVEQWFSTGLYPALQAAVTPVSNVLPFAVFDILTLGVGAWALITLVNGIRGARRTGRWSVLGGSLGRLVTAGAVVYIVFLCVWGFNYRRVSMADRLVLDRRAPSPDAVLALGLDAAARLNALHAAAHAQGFAAEPWRDERMRAAFADVQYLLSDAPDAVPGRLKTSIYGLYFRWAGVDGMVNPFGLEVIGNPDLLPWETPFVAAHEWAHLAGFADESEANFVGWLTCLRSDVGAQYSGWLYLYSQINGESGSGHRARLAAALTAGPRRDIDAIVDRLVKGQLPVLRNASWRVYDQYLKANRVEEGVASYGAVVSLILRARFGVGWTPVRREPAPSSR